MTKIKIRKDPVETQSQPINWWLSRTSAFCHLCYGLEHCEASKLCTFSQSNLVWHPEKLTNTATYIQRIGILVWTLLNNSPGGERGGICKMQTLKSN